MTAAKRKVFVIGMVAFGCCLAMLLLLWREEYEAFYTVLIGAAYFYIDRVHKEESEDEN
jgi:hypothetical protein